MKPKILLCCICALLFFSCKKEKKAPVQKLYPLAFNVSGFSISQVPIGKARPTSLKTHNADSIPVQSLVYLLYPVDYYATPISVRRMNKGDTDYGRFTDNVPAGNYVAVFIGGSSKLQTVSRSRNSQSDLGEYYTYSTLPLTPDQAPAYWDETFYTNVPITVTNTSIDMTVTMTRVTSRLDVIFKDPIPSGTTKIVMGLGENTAMSNRSVFGFGAGAYTATFNLSPADAGKTNYMISAYVVGTSARLIISYYGADPVNPLGKKEISPVKLEANKITTLSGNLFYPGNSEYDINVNTDWNTPINVGF